MFLLGISPAKVRFFSDATPSVRAKPRRPRARCVLLPAGRETPGWLAGTQDTAPRVHGRPGCRTHQPDKTTVQADRNIPTAAKNRNRSDKVCFTL